MHILDTDKISRKQLIELTGMSATHFHKLKNQGIFVSVERGYYNLKDCINNWCQYHADGRSGSDMAKEKEKLIVAQRKQIELRMKTEQSELVPLSEAQNAFDGAMVLISTQLDGLPGRVAGEVAGLSDPAEVRGLLFNETRRIRATAADELQSWANKK